MQFNDADGDHNEDVDEETDCLIGNKWSGGNEGSVETMCCAGVTTLFSGTLT